MKTDLASELREKYQPRIGIRYGYWTVIGPVEGEPKKVWVKCDCGTVKKVWAANLVLGKTKQCRSGCQKPPKRNRGNAAWQALGK